MTKATYKRKFGTYGSRELESIIPERTWQQAGRLGAGAVAESLYPDQQTGKWGGGERERGGKRETGNGMGF